jgi:hypothetical protein
MRDKLIVLCREGWGGLTGPGPIAPREGEGLGCATEGIRD